MDLCTIVKKRISFFTKCLYVKLSLVATVLKLVADDLLLAPGYGLVPVVYE